MRARFIRPARDELHEAYRYYESQQHGLGQAFHNEVRAALHRVQERPLAWQLLGGSIRRCQVHRFPYGLIYDISPHEILILAVAHLHRRPGYWQQRPR